MEKRVGAFHRARCRLAVHEIADDDLDIEPGKVVPPAGGSNEDTHLSFGGEQCPYDGGADKPARTRHKDNSGSAVIHSNRGSRSRSYTIPRCRILSRPL